MIYLGISCGFHDAALSLVDSLGNILFAAQSERYSKTKNDPSLDPTLIADLLSYLPRQDKLVLSYYEKPWLKFFRQLYSGEKTKLANFRIANILGSEIIDLLRPSKIVYNQHHVCHAAAGFQTSSFADATVVVIDAIGEWDTISIWAAKYKNDRATYKKLWSQKYPNSIGLFYSAMTDRVGLKANEEEYILMGMAAYGAPALSDLLKSHFLKNEWEIKFKENLHAGVDQSYLSYVNKIDLAASTQALTESLVLNVIRRAKDFNFSKNLVYMGGVALNCSINRRLGEYFDNIWIMPNPGDAGSSLGAAALAYGSKLNWIDAFLGHNIPGVYPVNAILDELIRNGIAAVANGRAEFGPRALGNRSLLADPRGFDIKNKVNEIKQRQKFRPFAPVILEELVNDYFEMPTNWPISRYMQTVATCYRPDLFPAVVHYDGTSRVQTVPNDGSGIRQLLEKWFVLTGCPMLLNTSLNIRGQPMINDINDAKRFQTKYGIPVFS